MFDEDFDVFFDPDEFGDRATYTPSGGSAAFVDGIFRFEYVDIDVGDGVPVAGLSAVFTCAAADVQADPEGDALTVRGEDYVVRVAQPDGTGTTKLVLEKV